MPQLFTIGYEGADPDRFVTALKGAGVAAIADVRAVALSRKRGFSKNVLRDRLAEEKIGYRHFIELGTPKAGREAARAGDEATLRRIYCDEVLTSPQAWITSRRWPGTSRFACFASNATRRGATAASLPIALRSMAFL